MTELPYAACSGCGAFFVHKLGCRGDTPRLPRARVHRRGFLSQPLPFGWVLHLARGKGYANVSLGRKTPNYPDRPQYHHHGLLIRWEVTTSDT